MNKSILRDLRQRTLAQEFRDSFRAGPRAWYVAAAVALGLGVLPFGLVMLPFFGVLILACVVLVLVPAFFGAALGRLAAAIRDARTLRRLQRGTR